MMWRALADVGLDKRLNRAADGLDTALQDSTSRLSGGELQRLLLAQVLLRPPVLAMLDEATGALDARSASRILSTLQYRSPQTALVVVSLSTGPSAIPAQVLLIDGRCVELEVHRDNAGTPTGPRAPKP